LSLRSALHLDAMPIPLEANCMKFQPFWGWRLASTTHYNKIIMGPIFPYVKASRACLDLGWGPRPICPMWHANWPPKPLISK
jgi:hypothetical protein